MVVVAIIGTLTSLAMPIARGLVEKAKDAEAPLNVRSLASLATAYYHGENDKVLLVAGGTNGMQTFNNFTSETSCQNSLVPNIGFKMTDCRKVHFVYGFLVAEGKQPRAYAVEGGTLGNKRIFSRCCASSFWLATGESATQVMRPSKGGSECGSNLNSFLLSKIGMSGSILDLDENGTVTGSEYGLITGPLNTVVAGTPMSHIIGCP